jgi:hypothetical protein
MERISGYALNTKAIAELLPASPTRNIEPALNI